jgi:hypothetical protein
MTNLRLSWLAVAVLLSACGSSESQPAAPAPATPVATETTPAEPEATPAADDDPAAGCVALFVRLRECTDEFIPALVGWRVELDVPAGIAKLDAEQGRDALVSTAMEEWKNDSTDEAIAGMCGQVVQSIPAEQLDAMIARGRECIAKDSCAEVVSCTEPMQRDRLQAQKAAEGN